MNDKYGTQRPYAASYVIVKNAEGKVAFVMRSNTSWMNGFYGLPSGKTEIGEAFSAGAIREAQEEIGIVVKSEDLKPTLTVHRNSKQNDGASMEWVDQYFLVTTWEGEAFNAEPDVHNELAWLDPDNLPDNVIPEIAASVKAWSEGKSYFEYGW